MSNLHNTTPARDGQERAQTLDVNNVAAEPKSAKESKQNGPLTYADIADQIERELNL